MRVPMRLCHSATGYLLFAPGISGSQLWPPRASRHVSRLTALRLMVNLTALAVLDLDLWKPASAKCVELGSR
jgi:hypothetical protein